MSIQTEITRINNAVEDIKDAITAKGVTVPTGSKVDDLPQLISSIQSGHSMDDSTLFGVISMGDNRVWLYSGCTITHSGNSLTIGGD